MKGVSFAHPQKHQISLVLRISGTYLTMHYEFLRIRIILKNSLSSPRLQVNETAY
jgi:hypothetical protein